MITDKNIACPVQNGSVSPNSSSSSELSMEINPLKETWAEEVERNELDSRTSLEYYDDSNDRNDNSSIRNEIVHQACENSGQRNIEVQFLDNVNEKKYERLVQSDKLKTNFKRRHSNSGTESRSITPNSSGSENDRDSEKGKTSNFYKPRISSLRYNEKRLRHNSTASSASSTSKYVETDPATLSRRQKQIDYGKNTTAYERYIESVPKSKRSRNEPSTPDKFGKYSRRAFDGLIKLWRKQLHKYDPPNSLTDENDENDNDEDNEDEDEFSDIE